MYVWRVMIPKSCDAVADGASNWQEERLRRGDDLRLQMAIEESKREKPKPEEVRVALGLLPAL